MARKILLREKYLTKSPAQTRQVGAIFAKKILKIFSQRKKAFILGLEGDLGGGKTTFLQGLAKGLGIKEKILSPTFVILKKFKTRNSKFETLYHIDCYRIKKAKEILDLGFKKIIADPQNIVAIEWADRIRKILPKGVMILDFEFVNKRKRKITAK